MGDSPSPNMDSFIFGDDGFFYDPFGEPCVLMGTVEFRTLCHRLDGAFASPLGRKLIYAATDAEERALRGQSSVQFGRWFGKSKATNRLRQRATEMGWGGFEDDGIVAPAHDALTVGFSLAHHEHAHRRRANVEWVQSSAEVIHLTFSDKPEPMVPASAPEPLSWFGSTHAGLGSGRIEMLLDQRERSFFNGEERSFFLSPQFFWHLFDALLGRPLAVDYEPSVNLDVKAFVEQPAVFSAVVDAACTAFSASERPVYVQTPDDWLGHFNARITGRGFGHVRVEKSLLSGDDVSVFDVLSPVAPVAVGLLIGMWQRAHGTVGDVKIEPLSEGLRVSLRLRSVDYL
ncbi:hypothetical protein CMO85_04905 [Candidatus Woesearchaeota archaeon]|nr:hypothetical protein [Candidatus Woesearchaeota archaeon]